jgi:hypothetical protein
MIYLFIYKKTIFLWLKVNQQKVTQERYRLVKERVEKPQKQETNTISLRKTIEVKEDN